MHLFSLPNELLHDTCEYLSYSDLWSLSQTCERWRSITFSVLSEKYNIQWNHHQQPFRHLVYSSLGHLSNDDDEKKAHRIANGLTVMLRQQTPSVWPDSIETLEDLLAMIINIIVDLMARDTNPSLESLALLIHRLDQNLSLSFDLVPPLPRLLMTALDNADIKHATRFMCCLLTNDTLGIRHARAFAETVLPSFHLAPDTSMRLLLDIVHATQLKTPQPGDIVHLTALVRLLQDSFNVFHTAKSPLL